MSKFYADRIFVSSNQVAVSDVKTFSMNRTRNLTRVETMTRNRRSAGFKRGNLGISGSFEVDIPELEAAIDLALKDPDASIDLNIEAGGDKYTIKGIEESTMDLNGSVGDASKSFSWEGLDIVNENGTSVNVSIALG